LVFNQLEISKFSVLFRKSGMTDTTGRMHSDAQFAGSSSVPAHVEMMGFLGIGNNSMVGCTVACAVDVATALNKSLITSDRQTPVIYLAAGVFYL